MVNPNTKKLRNDRFFTFPGNSPLENFHDFQFIIDEIPVSLAFQRSPRILNCEAATLRYQSLRTHHRINNTDTFDARWVRLMPVKVTLVIINVDMGLP